MSILRIASFLAACVLTTPTVLLANSPAPAGIKTASLVRQPAVSADGKEEALSPSLAERVQEMSERDRFAKPEPERDAWLAFQSEITGRSDLTPQLAAWTEMHVAISYFYTKQYDKAWEAIGETEKLLTANGIQDWRYKSELLAYGSLISTDLKEMDRAREYAERAMEQAISDFGADSAETGLAHNAKSYMLFKSGDLKSAKPHMCKAAELAEKHLPLSDPMVVNNMTSCGVIMYFEDELATADMMEKAATIAHNHLPKEHPVTSLAMHGSAGVLTQFGRYAEAETLFRRLLELELEIREKGSPDVYNPMSMLSETLLMQGKTEDALSMARAAYDYAFSMNAGGDPSSQGNAASQVGRILSSLGQHEEALGFYRKSFETNAANLEKDHLDIGLSQIAYARSLMANGKPEAALKNALQGRQILNGKLGSTSRKKVEAEFTYAKILSDLGRSDEALALSVNSAAKLEKLLFDYTASRPQLVSLSPIMTNGFGRHALIAMRAGDEDEAVRAAQLALASELFLANADLAARAAAKNKGLGDLVDQLRKARLAERAAKEKLVAAEAKGDGELSALSRTAAELAEKVRSIESELSSQFPELAKISRPSVPTREMIQNSLQTHQAAILPVSLQGRILTIAVTKDRVYWSEGEAEGQKASQLRRNIRNSINDARLLPATDTASFDTQSAHDLFKIIFSGKLYEQLADQNELLFPASGILASLPPAVLLTRPFEDDGQLANASWLIREKSIAVVSDLALGTTHSGKKENLKFAGLGAPVLAESPKSEIAYAALFRGGEVDIESLAQLPSLPAANTELSKMSEEFGAENSVILTGTAFNERAIKSLDFKPYSVVTFATHGLTSGEVAGLSEPALVFTPPDERTDQFDGLLTASEIAGMNIPADWVILSACNSGGGRNASAPTYSGLAKAFRLAGSKSLLLSHWPVRDDAATLLSVNTVRQSMTGGTDRAKALQRSMLDLMTNSKIPGASHPAVWAPFILIGN